MLFNKNILNPDFVDQDAREKSVVVNNDAGILLRSAKSLDDFAGKYSPFLWLIKGVAQSIGKDTIEIESLFSWQRQVKNYTQIPINRRIFITIITFLLIFAYAWATNHIN